MTRHTPPTPARGRPLLLLDQQSAHDAAAIRRFNAAGWTVSVVLPPTSGDDAALADALHQQLQAELEAHGGHIDAIYFCPHRSTADCECRTSPTALFRAALDAPERPPTVCVAVGDTLAGLEPARRMGCRTVLIQVAHETAPAARLFQPDASLPDLSAVADWALSEL